MKSGAPAREIDFNVSANADERDAAIVTMSRNQNRTNYLRRAMENTGPSEDMTAQSQQSDGATAQSQQSDDGTTATQQPDGDNKYLQTSTGHQKR